MKEPRIVDMGDFNVTITGTDGPFCYGWWDDVDKTFYEIVFRDGEYEFYHSPLGSGSRRFHPTDEQRKLWLTRLGKGDGL